MLRDNLARVTERIHNAARRAGRSPDEIQLMAVTKTVDEAMIAQAIAAGVRLIGENKVQELAHKRDALNLEGCEMHLIGHLQSNKAARAVACADMIQSVDSIRIAREISNACQKQGKTMPVLLEVNIGRDAAKFGFMPEETPEALAEIAEMQGIVPRGLMTVPPLTDDKIQTKKFFSQMYRLFLDIQGKKMDNISMYTMEILSMGMSGDFELAIEEGATLVRVGSAIFGQRNYN